MWVHFGSFQWTSITNSGHPFLGLTANNMDGHMGLRWILSQSFGDFISLSVQTQVFHVSHFIAAVFFSISKSRLHFRNFLASEEGLAETRLRCFDTQSLLTLQLEPFNLDFYQSESSSGVWPSCLIKRREAFPVTYLVMSKQNLINTHQQLWPSEALNHLRQNAEEDLSNILHIQSTLPSATKWAKLEIVLFLSDYLKAKQAACTISTCEALPHQGCEVHFYPWLRSSAGPGTLF